MNLLVVALVMVAAYVVWPATPRPSSSAGRPESSSVRWSHAAGALAAAVGVAVLVGGAVGVGVSVPVGAGAWWLLERRPSPDAVRRAARLRDDLPLAVDLVAVALRAGTAPASALALSAEAVGGPAGQELGAVARRLVLGAEPGAVWRELADHQELAPLGRALGRAHRSGASVVTAAERLGTELRDRSRSEVEARARSVSTRAAAPLGACFLPAFVLLGIVPMVAGLVRSLHLLG